MTSYLFLKKQRELTGLTIREFCEKVNISIGSFVGYQNGNKSLLLLPLEKAIRIFELLETNIAQFYNDFFPELKQETIQKVLEWNCKHYSDLYYDIVWKRYKMRIAKIKERKKLSDADINQLIDKLNDIFFDLKPYIDDNGLISGVLYIEKVLPFSSLLQQKMDESIIKNPAAAMINDAFHRSEMTYVELGKIVNVTPRRLAMCRDSIEGYSKMKIGSVLKICYALDVPVNDFFNIC